MSQSEQLRAMVATMLMVSPEQVGPETSLRSLDTSLGGARLRLGVKRLGAELPANFVPSTFGQMEAALSGKPEAAASPVPAEIRPTVLTSPPLTGVQVGLDVEAVKSLPVAADYWEHEFYTGMFGKSEIAYAVVQAEPRIHLAGFWCAKEALRKCDPSFLTAGYETTVVMHESGGRPYLVWRGSTGDVRLPHSLSVSHTGELATAVVVAIEAPPPQALPAPPPPREETKPAQNSSARLVLAAVIVLIVIAGYFLVRR